MFSWLSVALLQYTAGHLKTIVLHFLSWPIMIGKNFIVVYTDCQLSHLG